MFNGKNILITGGTGSFGKKYAEILLKKFNPPHLLVAKSRYERKARSKSKKYRARIKFTDKNLNQI